MTKVLKIGGSILTDKTRGDAARQDEISRVAEEIAARPEDLVLVHGAGSFGHFPAKKYGLPLSFSPEGLRVTHDSVARLNDLVVEALSRAGVDSLPVHPLSCLLLSNGRIDSFALGPLKAMLEERPDAGAAWRCGHGCNTKSRNRLRRPARLISCRSSAGRGRSCGLRR